MKSQMETSEAAGAIAAGIYGITMFLVYALFVIVMIGLVLAVL